MNMNTLLAQMLASQSEHLDPMEALAQQVVERYGENHPMAQLVRFRLAQRSELAEEDDGGDDEEADFRMLETLLREQPAPEVDPPKRPAASGTRRQIIALAIELREMRHRSEVFARAVGACNACWGGDPECPNCHGAGVPGAFAIDQELFARFIAPAVAQCRGKEADKKPTDSQTGRRANYQSENGE